MIGGFVVSGRQQGEESASMAVQILKGLRAEDIPILRESPNVFMFDHGVMERFGIKETALPKGSIVINKPQTLLSQYGIWVFGFLLVGVIQTFLILALLHHRNRSKAANDGLRESEKRLRALFAAVSDPVLVADRDTGILVECNEAAARYFGRPREELIGLPQRELHSPETPRIEGVTEDFKRQVAEPGFANNVRFMAAGGIIRLADVSASAFEIGESRLILGVFRDVTEQRQAEEALRESDRFLKSSQQIARLGSWSLDLATNQVVWTEELYRMCGFDPSLPPPPYNEHMKLFTPESWARLSTALAHTAETGIPYELELETVGKDGITGWMWVRGEAVKDADGRITSLWGPRRTSPSASRRRIRCGKARPASVCSLRTRPCRISLWTSRDIFSM